MKKNINYFRKKGDSQIFATSMGLLLSLLMVAWIVTVILTKGLGFFWPRDLTEITLNNGEKYLGEKWEAQTDKVLSETGKAEHLERLQLKIGNRDIYGVDFKWMDNANIKEVSHPQNATVFERLEYGNFYGFIDEIHTSQETFTAATPDFISKAQAAHKAALRIKMEIENIQAKITLLTKPLTHLHREINLLEISAHGRTIEGRNKLKALREKAAKIEQNIADEHQLLTGQLTSLIEKDQATYVLAKTVDNQEKEIHLSHVVRFFQPNAMGIGEKTLQYAAKLWEFVAADPRESNTEGGVFPAIFGTVLMVLLMSIAVVPFGVMAAIYLNEYAKQGTIVRFIRLSVNNLAGVPSIVFGVFGLGFFVYVVGGGIDQLFFSAKLPEPTFGTGGILWASLTLALLTLPVVVVATEEGLLAVPRANKEAALALGSTRWQMIRKVALPNAMPGILTGLILAISRGAGEVAPLMITGVVKLAPSLALDGIFPFLHLDRKFMHLGFHIYDVGFQSPNVEAAKPMVYSTALLLIVIVILLNFVAIYFRNRLKKKFKTSTF